MLSLVGKVGLDTNPFIRAFRGLRGAVSPVGAQIGREFSKQFMNYVGIKAMVNAVKDAFTKAAEVRKGALNQSVDTDTYQQLQKISDQTGASIEQLTDIYNGNAEASTEMKEALKAAMEEVKEQGGVVDAETVETLANAWDKFGIIMGRLAPVIASVATGLLKVYDIASRATEVVTAWGMQWWGAVTNDKNLMQAGGEMITDVKGGDPNASLFQSVIGGTGEESKKTENAKIKSFARIFAQESEKEKEKTEKKDTGTAGSASRDQLARIGGYIRGAPMARETAEVAQLKKVNALLHRVYTDLVGQLSK